MHELGIATSVLDSVNSVAKQKSCISVEKINVCVGKKAGIIDRMFVEAFDMLKELEEYHLCKNAEIVSKLVDGRDVYVDSIQVQEKD